jgi:hypothetical protein
LKQSQIARIDACLQRQGVDAGKDLVADAVQRALIRQSITRACAHILIIRLLARGVYRKAHLHWFTEGIA